MKLCDFDIIGTSPFFLIAGPWVIESEALARQADSRQATRKQQRQA